MAALPRLLLLAVCLVLPLGCASLGTGCTGTENTLPVITDAPTLVSNVSHGTLYVYHQVDPPLYVSKLSGTAFEMGKAQGELLKVQINEMFGQFEGWVDDLINQYIDFLPDFLVKIVDEAGVFGALEATLLMTEPYTPDNIIDYMKGLGEGSGIEYRTIWRYSLLPELIQAACSMYGAWGDAVPTHMNGGLLQLRALDWNTNGPFQKYPIVNVFNPTDEGHPFSTLGWTGFVGALTGFSSSPVGVCEKVWLSYKGEKPRIGYPWTYLLRNILQTAEDVDSALSQIASADRTCSIFIGLGDPVNKFKAVEYSYEEVNIYDAENFPVYSGHPKMSDLVYIDKHVQPSHDPCLGSLLEHFHGNITADNTIRYITALFQTGDMHIAVMDFNHMHMYVSNAGPYENGTAQPAYDRQFIRLNMKEYFA